MYIYIYLYIYIIIIVIIIVIMIIVVIIIIIVYIAGFKSAYYPLTVRFSSRAAHHAAPHAKWPVEVATAIAVGSVFCENLGLPPGW